MVKVRFYSALLVAAGQREYRTEARSVAGLLSEVREHFGDGLADSLEGCTVLVNGRNVESLKGARTRLRDGDEVSLLPRIVGG